MRLSDLVDLGRALSILMKLVIGLVVLLILLNFVCSLLRQVSFAEGFEMLSIFFLLSPLAYFIREWRRGGKPQRAARRGAERTPLLPQHEEAE